MNKIWNVIQAIAVFFLRLIFKILHKELTDKTIDAFLQFVKFGIVGLSNTLISYITYIVILVLFQRVNAIPTIDYLIAQAIAFVISVLWSFYWNNKYVFTLSENEERSIWKALLKTYMSYAFSGLFLNSVLSILWVDVLHWSKYIAPIINLLISVPLNFVINKFWAFKKDTRVEE